MKHKSLTASMVLLAVGIALSVWGDPTSISISSGSVTVTGPSSTTLHFPIARSGDTSYDAFVQYQTQDGTAIAGTDYTAAMGSLVIPAGATSATIPVTVAGSNISQADKTFQMLLLGGLGAGMGFTPSFAAQQTFGTGGDDPYSVTAADINGDGKPDLIIANAGDHTVSVLLNTTAPGATTPSFATPQTFASGGQPYSVVAADVNGDGKPDLIVANFDNTVSVLLNTTAPGAVSPSFAAQQSFATGNVPISVTAADVNGDGKPDLIVANSSDNTVSVLLNTTAPGATTPSFATQQTFATGNVPFSVTAADINGDGLPDLIVSNGSGNTVSVLLNTTAPGATTPSFANQQTFATGNFPFSVTAADVNGDGKPDLIVANSIDGTVMVLLNTTGPGATTPSFAAQQTFATGTEPISVTAADVNGDGKPDLIVANYVDGTVSVLLNTTPAPTTTFDGYSFSAAQAFAAGSYPDSVTAADVNGDGKPDLIVVDNARGIGSGNVSVLLNTTAPGATVPSFATGQTFATGNGPNWVTAADLNGDGLPDLIVANYSDNTVSVLLNTTAPGATTPSFANQQTFATGSFPFSVTAADVNGDGLPDLIVANQEGGVSVLLNTTAPGATTPSFATQQTFAAGANPSSVAVADVNGDGLPDLIVTNENGKTVSVLLNTTPPGATTLSFATQQTFATGNIPFSATAVDVNGDGLPDLIVANEGDATVSVLLNTTAPGATVPSFAPQQTFATGSNPESIAAADVNGDGLPDLIVANLGSSTVSVLLNTTAPGAAVPSFATQRTFAANSPFSVTAADINGDGMPDLIVANAGQAAGTVSVLLNALYAVTASSPATGTIQYSVPTPSPTATATATATATPTATPTTSISVPASLAMGNSPVGDTATKNLTVRNTGTNLLFIGSVTSNNSAEFAATGATTCPPGGLAHLATCTIAIGFTPSALGTRIATLTVNDNAATSPARGGQRHRHS